MHQKIWHEGGMNILNIMLGRGRGGIEQAALDYAHALRGAGAEVLTVLSPSASILTTAELLGLPYATLRNAGAWDRLAAWKLAHIARAFEAEAVIAHGNRALCLAALARMRVPIVTVAHNYRLQHFGKADAAFCITRQAMEAVEGAHPSLREKCYFVPNMIAAVNTPTRHAFQHPPHIGAMGRMVAKKGFDVWLRALALLKERGVPFQATLAGEGEEKDKLSVLCDTLGLQAEVTFAGWVESIDAFYASIDLFCIPSHHEPFGIVILEAMVRGLPVLATESEGAREILANPKHGVLTPLNDPVAMADALAALLANPEGTLELGARACAHALSTYNMQVIAQQMQTAFMKIVQKH
jgi:glycosyltransferase involved in cell wall biosynthesis